MIIINDYNSNSLVKFKRDLMKKREEEGNILTDRGRKIKEYLALSLQQTVLGHDYEPSTYPDDMCKDMYFCPNPECGKPLREEHVPIPEKDMLVCDGCGYKYARDNSCFITTACIEAKGLPDNCDELNILRLFRDEYVKELPDGTKLIGEYYEIAPEIVARINAMKDKNEIYNNVFKIILKCVELIKSGKKEEAFKIYCNTVIELKKKYLN